MADVQVRMRVGLAGVDFALASGDLYTCDAAAAARLVAAGFADYPLPPVAAPPPVVETTMAPAAPERAVKPRGRARG